MVEIVFLMLVLKLPILYLIGVVWWAVRAEPRPPEPAPLLVPADEPVHSPPRARRSRRRGGPHDRGRSPRRPARTAVR